MRNDTASGLATLTKLHVPAALTAFALILVFWTSTIAVEILGSTAAVAWVKSAIAWGLLILVPAIAITGISGFRMAQGSQNRDVLNKKRRMPLIGANGVFILAPAAITLAILAARGDFGPMFVTVQTFELIAGAINLTLMALNIRDGRRLTGWKRA
jgi:hypothetical protein